MIMTLLTVALLLELVCEFRESNTFVTQDRTILLGAKMRGPASILAVLLRNKLYDNDEGREYYAGNLAR